MPRIIGGVVIEESGQQRLHINAGAPVDGTSGTLAGIAEKGSLLIDTSTPDLYINANTKASPTWKKFTRAA